MCDRVKRYICRQSIANLCRSASHCILPRRIAPYHVTPHHVTCTDTHALYMCAILMGGPNWNLRNWILKFIGFYWNLLDCYWIFTASHCKLLTCCWNLLDFTEFTVFSENPVPEIPVGPSHGLRMCAIRMHAARRRRGPLRNARRLPPPGVPKAQIRARATNKKPYKSTQSHVKPCKAI